MKTYSAKPTDVKRTWHLIDAGEVPLGRLASVVATLLTGKHKPMFTHHIDCGDYVVVTNADNLVVTGSKLQNKEYFRHSQYPGGLKSRSLGEQMQIDSTAVIIHAVRGMLPVNKLRKARLERLKVYADGEHKHEAQSPIPYSLKEKS